MDEKNAAFHLFWKNFQSLYLVGKIKSNIFADGDRHSAEADRHRG